MRLELCKMKEKQIQVIAESKRGYDYCKMMMRLACIPSWGRKWKEICIYRNRNELGHVTKQTYFFYLFIYDGYSSTSVPDQRHLLLGGLRAQSFDSFVHTYYIHISKKSLKLKTKWAKFVGNCRISVERGQTAILRFVHIYEMSIIVATF